MTFFYKKLNTTEQKEDNQSSIKAKQSQPVRAFCRHSLFAALAATSIAFTGCSSPDAEQNQDTTAQATDTNIATNTDSNVTNTNSSGEVTLDTAQGKITVPTNPNPVAVYDMTLIQDLAALDVPVQGLPQDLLIEHTQAENTPKAQSIGTVFEPNLEELNALQPQAILIGNRMAKHYAAISAVAPTLDLSLAFEDLYNTSKQRLAELGILFDKQAQAAKLQQDIDDAIAKTQAMTKDRGNGMVVSIQGNKLSTFGLDSRFGYVHKQFGIPIADPSIGAATHGEPISFEYIQKINPDWLLVLDHDAATGKAGENARVVLDNPLIQQTTAWQKQQIIYLSRDSYLAFGSYYHWINDAKLIQAGYSKAQ
ncbi:siderophore ABC transporter substrate-binding protein [Psychrobacter sp. I-STPA10]|uniref:siderophore ABC transporter substrate-binding protein n=1 Tax=Psychrobacter sp. I-STPA10 TaxID=2585769 RepID=UPI001E5E8056|nr:siderophore ABC transporter substrate-binding protein [Psychrobacter sp. I-STPA10]